MGAQVISRPKAKKAKTTKKDDTAFERVGRFASFGLTEIWQTALLMPTGYEDLREVSQDRAEAEGKDRAVIWLATVEPPRASFSSGVPRTSAVMEDARGAAVRVVAFGDSKEWIELLNECAGGYFLVQPQEYRGEISFRILELIDPEWVGRLRPQYPGKPNYMSAETVREKVIAGLPKSIVMAAGYIESELAPLVSRERLLAAAGLPDWTLEQVLQETHMPVSPRMAETAREVLHRIAAFAALAKVHSHTLARPRVMALKLNTWPVRMGALPFTSTIEQRQVVLDIVRDMARPVAMKRCVLGDTGSGKSATFMTAAVATVDAGGRVAILLPTHPLAEQIHREIDQSWPDVAAKLVTSDTPDIGLEGHALLVGTTALLHRTVGEFNLVVVDEEQKFSVEQRSALAGLDAHTLTSTATCIPRSQALARYGAVDLSILRGCHVEKLIDTRLWGVGQKRTLFNELTQFLKGDDQLLVVYPMRHPGEDMDPLLSVASAVPGWEGLYPGMVRSLTGEDTDDTKSAVLADMREGRAKILLTTTVVEVGITIPGLRRAMIVAPERYGLSTIHQIRGRVAREGGQGWCDLYSPLPLKDKQANKLDLFVRCKDGFEVAELDLELRGFGDLAQGSTKQSGADDSFLFGSAITPSHVTPMEGLWMEICSLFSNPH